MAVPLSTEAQLLLKLLEDGAWYPAEEILDRLSGQIAPGKALRRYNDREATRQEKEGPRKGPELSESERIASGQRTLANVALNSMKKNYIDIAYTDSGRIVRKRPTGDNPGPPPVQIPAPEPPVLREEPTPEPPTVREEFPSEFTCLQCGMWVVNGQQHATFHAEQAARETGIPSDVAFMSESMLRSIINDEITTALGKFNMEIVFTEDEARAMRALVRVELDDALDAFQKGLQAYLDERLASMEAVARTAALRALARMPHSTGWFGK